MYPVSFPCGLLHDIYRKKVVSPYDASPYCLFPGCIVTWEWSLAKGQYMVEWVLTGAPPNKERRHLNPEVTGSNPALVNFVFIQNIYPVSFPYGLLHEYVKVWAQ